MIGKCVSFSAKSTIFRILVGLELLVKHTLNDITCVVVITKLGLLC